MRGAIICQWLPRYERIHLQHPTSGIRFVTCLGWVLLPPSCVNPINIRLALYEREKRKKKRYYFGGESSAEKMVKSVILVKKWKNRNVFGIL